MKLTLEEQQTLDSYNQHAADWSISRSGKGIWAAEKAIFHRYLPIGRILEIGSGGGRDASEFIEMGYEYTGTDISAGLLKEARKNNPGATFIEKSVYELDFPAESFDGFWACAVLLHMPKSRIDDALQSIRGVLKKDAIGFISLKQGDGERMVEGDHVGIQYKRFFAFYKEEEFLTILKRNNYEVIESYVTDHSDKKWLVFFVRLTV